MISKVLPFFKVSSGCDYHRIVLPLMYAGYDFSKIKKFTKEELLQFKVLYFNRIPMEATLQTITNMQKLGFKVVMDLDDYWVLGEDHYLHKHWKHNKVTENIIEFMKIADRVTCTTQRLADKIKQYNTNVVVIPNALPIDIDQFKSDKSDSKHTRFGFVGGPSHAHDLRLIAPVFQHYNHLNFSMAGYNHKHKESCRMRDICSNNGKNPNYNSIASTPLGTYMYAYDSLDCCIAPLTGKEFNKYKSNLKILEAGAKKCAIICSPVECYTDTVPDSVVTYCKSVKDWKEAIKKHQDLEYTKERGENLYNWVKENYNLGTINQQRINLLCDIQQETQRQEDLSPPEGI
jgi:glycosyltransferase involved in cell wall biosynthesis